MKENLNCDFSLIQLEYLIYSFIHYMLTEKWRDRQIHDISIFICKVKKSVYCKKVGGQPPPLPMIRKACSGVFSGSHIGLDHYSMRKNYELDMLLQKSCFTIHTTAKILIRWFEWTHQSLGTDLWGRGGGGSNDFFCFVRTSNIILWIECFIRNVSNERTLDYIVIV